MSEPPFSEEPPSIAIKVQELTSGHFQRMRSNRLQPNTPRLLPAKHAWSEKFPAAPIRTRECPYRSHTKRPITNSAWPYLRAHDSAPLTHRRHILFAIFCHRVLSCRTHIAFGSHRAFIRNDEWGRASYYCQRVVSAVSVLAATTSHAARTQTCGSGCSSPFDGSWRRMFRTTARIVASIVCGVVAAVLRGNFGPLLARAGRQGRQAAGT